METHLFDNLVFLSLIVQSALGVAFENLFLSIFWALQATVGQFPAIV